MNKYNITVTETCNRNYTVEAHSEEEALQLFSDWVDSHQEWVADDLLDCSCGWEYSKPEIVSNSEYLDITYDELKEVFK